MNSLFRFQRGVVKENFTQVKSLLSPSTKYWRHRKSWRKSTDI